MSDSAYGKPLLIKDDSCRVEFERLAMSASGGDPLYDEAFIQNLAFEHPECLPVSEIDRAYEQLVPVCMELNTPAGPLDALYVTPTGRLVIVEAKLWRNPEARRKVVGQILDYAQELSCWDYADLQREVSRRLNQKGNVLFDLVAAKYPDVDEATFVDEVQLSLGRGRFLLMILGDGIRRGAAAITNFLEAAGRLEFTFGLVELALFRHADAGLLIQPRVIAKTVEIGRSIIQLTDGVDLVESRIDSEEDGDPDADERKEAMRRYYRAFWTEFLDQLQLDDVNQPMPNMSKSALINFPMPPKGSATYLKLYFSKAKNRVGVFVKMPRGNYGATTMQALLADREAIEAELGLSLIWNTDEDIPKIVHYKEFSDVHGEQERAAIQSYFADTVNRFVNTFRPRLQRIGEENS